MMRVLFVCGKARHRSPTAAHVAQRWSVLEADFAGLSRDADEAATPELLDWADVIMVMETRQKKRLRSRFDPPRSDVKVISLDVPDKYGLMDQELVGILDRKLRHHFGPPDEDSHASNQNKGAET